MAFERKDRVKDATTTTGTGTVTLTGTAPSGYRSVSAAHTDGATVRYAISMGAEWEVGEGVYTATGPTLSRATVLASSNAGALVNFSAGTKDVITTLTANEVDGLVKGPVSATADSLARFDGTTGTLLKDGAVIGTDVAALSSNIFTGTQTHQAQLRGAPKVDVASAATIDLTAVASNVINITGTSAISTVTLNDGTWVFGRFASTASLVQGASLHVHAGGSNFQATADDSVLFFRQGTVVEAIPFRADGTPVVGLAQIQPISASVGANALTISASTLSLSFRSTTLGSGAVTTVSTLPGDLVISSGATLGTVSGKQSRIAVLAINNANSIELAVVNLAGGLNLDETTLISTTAISAAATAANVIYSTTARTNVPFRVVGFIDITEATAGTWATAPSVVQGIGGQALAAMSSIGYGQTWQVVTGSRASGTTYYNTTGRPITVVIGASGTNSSVTLTINGVTVGYSSSNSYVPSVTAIVPPGGSYSAVVGPTLNSWTELR